MLNIHIGGNPYKVVDSWEEITIGQAAELLPVLLELPDNLIGAYRLSLDGKKDKVADTDLTDEQVIKTIPETFGKILEKLSDIPPEVIEYIPTEDRVSFYNQHLIQFAVGLLHFPYDYEPTGQVSFKHKGKRYYMPGYGEDVNGEPVPMEKVKAVTFAESSDLMLAAKGIMDNKFSYMAQVVATICSPEKYDVKKVKKVAESFQDLPMSIVWEVFFYSVIYTSTLKESFPMLFQKAKAESPESPS